MNVTWREIPGLMSFMTYMALPALLDYNLPEDKKS